MLTRYAQVRFGELLEQGLVNTNGEITDKGKEWIDSHPNTEPPCTHGSGYYNMRYYIKKSEGGFYPDNPNIVKK